MAESMQQRHAREHFEHARDGKNRDMLPYHQYLEAVRENAELRANLAAAERRLSNEYVCTCGIRVTPHRCATGEDF